MLLKNFLLLFIATLICYNSFGQVCPDTGFEGNRRVSITSITPVIDILYTTGETPFFTYLSAYQTTATGATDPYTDIEYSWDFGDVSPTGNVSFTHPVSSKTVYANTCQKGPEAAYLYKTPGTYTITLTAKAWNGSEYITNATTTTVTVNEWSGEDRYFDPTNGDDGNAGTSADSPWKTWDKLNSWISGGSNRRALIKKGEIMMITSMVQIRYSKIRFAAYGEGDSPILRADENMEDNIIYILASTNNIEDQVFSDIVFDVNGVAGSVIFGYSTEPGSLKQITLDNCQLNNGYEFAMLNIRGTDTSSGFLIWNCSINSNQGGSQGFIPKKMPYCAVIGSFFDGGNGNLVLDHHMYINDCSHTLIRWVKFGENVPSRSFCLNMNAAPYTGEDRKHFECTLIDGCDITGTNNGIDFSNSMNDSEGGYFTKTIVQNCDIHDLNTKSQGLGVFGYNVKDLTLRFNKFYNNLSYDLRIEDAGNTCNVYNNIFYVNSSCPHKSVQTITGQQGTFANNIFVNESPPGDGHFTGYFGGSSTWTIDNNQYWHPNLSEAFDALTFEEWQALGYDLNSEVSNPLFSDPANGLFGELLTADFNFAIANSKVLLTNLTVEPEGEEISYKWDFGDSSPNGATVSPVHRYSNFGSYDVTLTARTNSGTGTKTKQIIIDILNIDENKFNLLTAHLNSVDGMLNIEFDQAYENVDVSIINLNGTLISKSNYQNTNEVQINTNSLSEGLYYVKSNTDNNYSIKIFKK